MLIELRCNVMVRDFLKHTNDITANVYMNENTLRDFIDQWRVYCKWDEESITTDEVVADIKHGVTFRIYNVWVYYRDDVPDGYMRVMT